jgi:hypothetical protein
MEISNNHGLYDENDEVLDIDDMIPSDATIIDPNDSEDGENSNNDNDDEISEEEYKISSLSPAFLRSECEIKLESSKTMLKFTYRGDYYKGVVLQQFNDKRDEYIFLVEKCDKKWKLLEDKKMKKIYIPDVLLNK